MKIIIWILIAFLAYRLVRMFLLPSRQRNFNPYGQQQGRQGGGYSATYGDEYHEKRKQGETYINKRPESGENRRNRDDDGEYIDYKEVK